MYRCQNCKQRTEDIDEPNCKPDCPEFVPQEIEVIHKLLPGRIALCTGKPLKPRATGIGGNYGITCIRCRTAMQGQRTAVPVTDTDVVTDSDIKEITDEAMEPHAIVEDEGQLPAEEPDDTIPDDEDG